MAIIAFACLVAAPSRSLAGGAIVVNMNFDFLRQGSAGVITLTGPDMAGGVVSVLNRTYPFFPATGGFAALIAVPIEQRIKKDYPMTITVYRTDGTSANMSGTLRVESGEFIREPLFVVPSDRLYLLNMDVQTNEDARLLSVYSVVTPTRFWEGQFTLPVNAPLTSPFGSVRDYNDGTTRRHTGFDFKVASGTPIMAASSGRIAFARKLDIHGNSIIIDHGWGIFSDYSHLSQIFVVPGQRVLQGEIIGLSGNTGRSTGAHLHWEIAVDGIWVNPINFTTLKMPT
jgi:murein DD-endopeptidase MepM/ murein hydrolase activator NlpD